jgi:hypothetical protein
MPTGHGISNRVHAGARNSGPSKCVPNKKRALADALFVKLLSAKLEGG